MLHSRMKWSCFIVRRFYEAFCGDAAKYEAHLAMHEAALRAMKQSLTASFRHFFCKKKKKKMAAGNFYLPRHSERLFEAKNSEFRCEMKF